VKAVCDRFGARSALAKHWAEGGAGAEVLAHEVKTQLDQPSPDVTLLYPSDMALAQKIETVAKEIYRAEGIEISGEVARSLKDFEALGFGTLPICIAKTQYSFSTDPAKIGAPTGHILEVREVRLSAGAGFIVAVCGDIMTMPGLPRRPASVDIGLDADGNIVGLA
jgi:formate--tetrahydrofolate ligase